MENNNSKKNWFLMLLAACIAVMLVATGVYHQKTIVSAVIPTATAESTEIHVDPQYLYYRNNLNDGELPNVIVEESAWPKYITYDEGWILFMREDVAHQAIIYFFPEDHDAAWEYFCMKYGKEVLDVGVVRYVKDYNLEFFISEYIRDGYWEMNDSYFYNHTFGPSYPDPDIMFSRHALRKAYEQLRIRENIRYSEEPEIGVYIRKEAFEKVFGDLELNYYEYVSIDGDLYIDSCAIFNMQSPTIETVDKAVIPQMVTCNGAPYLRDDVALSFYEVIIGEPFEENFIDYCWDEMCLHVEDKIDLGDAYLINSRVFGQALLSAVNAHGITAEEFATKYVKASYAVFGSFEINSLSVSMSFMPYMMAD